MEEVYMNQNKITKEIISKKLNVAGISGSTLDKITSYYFVTYETMCRILEGFDMWTKKEVDGKTFFKALLSLFDIFRQNVDRLDGIVREYISHVEVSCGDTSSQAWSITNTSSAKPLQGIYKNLIDMGLPHHTIDEYYIDGFLMELYEECQRTISAINSLCNTKNPSILDLREGLFIMEVAHRKLYDQLFVKTYGNYRGYYGVILKVILRSTQGKEENR